MPLDDLPWKEILGAGGLGAAAVKAVDWLSSRTQAKAYTMGAVDHAVETAMRVVTNRLEVVEGQHQACDALLREVTRRLDASERERLALTAQIDRLMSGHVAEYGP